MCPPSCSAPGARARARARARDGKRKHVRCSGAPGNGRPSRAWVGGRVTARAGGGVWARYPEEREAAWWSDTNRTRTHRRRSRHTLVLPSLRGGSRVGALPDAGERGRAGARPSLPARPSTGRTPSIGLRGAAASAGSEVLLRSGRHRRAQSRAQRACSRGRAHGAASVACLVVGAGGLVAGEAPAVLCVWQIKLCNRSRDGHFEGA